MVECETSDDGLGGVYRGVSISKTGQDTLAFKHTFSEGYVWAHGGEEA